MNQMTPKVSPKSDPGSKSFPGAQERAAAYVFLVPFGTTWADLGRQSTPPNRPHIRYFLKFS